jgi:hypothetical protein
MQRTITHPAGIDPDGVDDVILPSATLAPAERLAIYGRSYHARLLESIRSFYPALLHALGDALFDHFATAYLHASPPTSYTLAQLTDSFPRWMAETRPEDGEGRWPDFVVELASLELAFRQVYDGPGLEGAPRTIDVAPRVIAAPSLRLFAFHFPVHHYHADVRRGETPEPPEPRDVFVALTRRDYRVVVIELPPEQFHALRALEERTDIPPIWIQEWLQRGLVGTR